MTVFWCFRDTSRQCIDNADAISSFQPLGKCSTLRMMAFRICCVYICTFVILNFLHITDWYLWFQNLRIYFTSSPETSHGALSTIFSNTFREFAEMSRRNESGTEPFFTLVPILGAGTSATSMDNILTCELLASKFQWQLFSFLGWLCTYLWVEKLTATPVTISHTHTHTRCRILWNTSLLIAFWSTALSIQGNIHVLHYSCSIIHCACILFPKYMIFLISILTILPAVHLFFDPFLLWCAQNH